MTREIEKNISEKIVFAEFENRRRKITLIAITLGVLVGAIVIIEYQRGVTDSVMAIVLAASFIWAILAHVKLWRCPSCNGHLGRLYLGLKEPRYCLNCGIKLIE